MITTNVPTLKIHKLTQAQYDRELANGNIDESAFYLTPDNEGASSDSYIIPIYRGDDDALHIEESFNYSGDALFNAVNNNYFVALKLMLNETDCEIYPLTHNGWDESKYLFASFLNNCIRVIELNDEGLNGEYEHQINVDTSLSVGGRPADAKAVGDALATKAPLYTYGTEDLVAGESELAAGTLYFVYEEEE